MKVALVCSAGGHLEEMRALVAAFEGHSVFYVTYVNPRTESLPSPCYRFLDTGEKPIRLLLYFPRFLRIMWRERPDLVVSTGAEIAIPFFLLAKPFRARTIYIESIARVRTLSRTARLVRRLSDRFVVQWEEMAREHRAEYHGRVV